MSINPLPCWVCATHRGHTIRPPFSIIAPSRPIVSVLPFSGAHRFQVMGLGHWGVLLYPNNQGGWGLMLSHNVFNPPPKAWDRSRRKAKADDGGDGDDDDDEENDDAAGMCPLED